MGVDRRTRQLINDITGKREVKKLSGRDLTKPAKAPLNHAYLFHYPRPKTKNILPYWDTRPIIIILARQGNNRVLGMNMNHIPYTYALQIAKGIQRKAKNKKRSLKYSDVKRAIDDAKLPTAYYMVGIKSYLTDRISGSVLPVNIANGEYYNALKKVPRKFKKMGLSGAMAMNRKAVTTHMKDTRKKG